MFNISKWSLIFVFISLLFLSFDFFDRFTIENKVYSAQPLSSPVFPNSITSIEKIGTYEELLNSYLKFDVKWQSTVAKDKLHKDSEKKNDEEGKRTLTIIAIFNEIEIYAVADIYDDNQTLLDTIKLTVGQNIEKFKVHSIEDNTVQLSLDGEMFELTLFKSGNSLNLNKSNDV